eukprot:TRINITY_DN3778_c0_g2_i2.p1 TRINITY_DN3778_c0_g2~~TRINITY_DN3778_c0_g2_i2.p1  ORF type:complete len:1237 (+),score=305.35 TRINITY_DN3778_c0_g2_i2:340-3711(+)
MEAEELSRIVGLDNTLDKEEEEDEFDRMAEGQVGGPVDGVVMMGGGGWAESWKGRVASDLGRTRQLPANLEELKRQRRDRRANHGDAQKRLEEDAANGKALEAAMARYANPAIAGKALEALQGLQSEQLQNTVIPSTHSAIPENATKRQNEPSQVPASEVPCEASGIESQDDADPEGDGEFTFIPYVRPVPPLITASCQQPPPFSVTVKNALPAFHHPSLNTPIPSTSPLPKPQFLANSQNVTSSETETPLLNPKPPSFSTSLEVPAGFSEADSDHGGSVKDDCVPSKGIDLSVQTRSDFEQQELKGSADQAMAIAGGWPHDMLDDLLELEGEEPAEEPFFNEQKATDGEEANLPCVESLNKGDPFVQRGSLSTSAVSSVVLPAPGVQHGSSSLVSGVPVAENGRELESATANPAGASAGTTAAAVTVADTTEKAATEKAAAEAVAAVAAPAAAAAASQVASLSSATSTAVTSSSLPEAHAQVGATTTAVAGLDLTVTDPVVDQASSSLLSVAAAAAAAAAEAAGAAGTAAAAAAELMHHISAAVIKEGGDTPAVGSDLFAKWKGKGIAGGTRKLGEKMGNGGGSSIIRDEKTAGKTAEASLQRLDSVGEGSLSLRDMGKTEEKDEDEEIIGPMRPPQPPPLKGIMKVKTVRESVSKPIVRLNARNVRFNIPAGTAPGDKPADEPSPPPSSLRAVLDLASAAAVSSAVPRFRRSLAQKGMNLRGNVRTIVRSPPVYPPVNLALDSTVSPVSLEMEGKDGKDTDGVIPGNTRHGGASDANDAGSTGGSTPLVGAVAPVADMASVASPASTSPPVNVPLSSSLFNPSNAPAPHFSSLLALQSTGGRLSNVQPTPPMRKRSRGSVPDYVQNPHKYTRYSLDWEEDKDDNETGQNIQAMLSARGAIADIFPPSKPSGVPSGEGIHTGEEVHEGDEVHKGEEPHMGEGAQGTVAVLSTEQQANGNGGVERKDEAMKDADAELGTESESNIGKKGLRGVGRPVVFVHKRKGDGGRELEPRRSARVRGASSVDIGRANVRIASTSLQAVEEEEEGEKEEEEGEREKGGKEDGIAEKGNGGGQTQAAGEVRDKGKEIDGDGLEVERGEREVGKHGERERRGSDTSSRGSTR